MTIRRRLTLLGLLATLLVLADGGFAALFLYRTALHQEGESLRHAVESQARLVEAVFDWELSGALGDTALALEATLTQLTSAQQRFRGFGRTGEFAVAQVERGVLRFHVGLREDAAQVPDSIRLPSELAVPMQRAVAGESGVTVARDYRGFEVVAAFTPVAGTPLGMVAKQDLMEVRAPYILAGLGAVGVGVVLILAFLVAGSRVGVPLLREVEEREAAHRTILDRFPGVAFRAVSDGAGAWHFDVFEGAAEALTGWPARRFLEDPDAWGAFVGDDGMAPLRRCLAGEDPDGGEEESTSDLRVRKKDGTELWVQTLVRRGTPESENRLCAVGVCQDITAVREKEEAVARIERALGARRAVDHALVVAGTEAEVWKGVSDALAGAGGYRMAWVAVPVPKTEGSVRSVASAGVDEEYLKEISVSWRQDDPRGLGPTGTALREGVVGVTKDIHCDARMGPWRRAAERHGFRSSAAIPVHAEGSVVAALNVYAPDPEAFDDPEVIHLRGLAQAVGSKIELLRSHERSAAVEGMFQAFMDANPAVSWLKDSQGRHLWVNPAWEAAYGLDHSGWVGKTEYDLLPPASADAVRQEDLEILETGRAVSGIKRLQTLRGREVVWRFVKFRLEGPRGVTRVGGMAVDMSSEVAAQDALRQSEERLRAALRAGGHGLYDLDLRTGNAEVNDDYARMIGHDPASFVETNAAWRDRLHPDDREKVYGEYEAYVAGKRDLYRVEFRQRMADGGWKWTLSLGEMVEWDDQGAPVRMVGTHTDIQGLKDAEAALRESEDRFRRAVESSPEAIFVQTRGNFAYVNPAAVVLFGVAAAGDLVGTPVSGRFAPEARADVMERIRKLNQERVAQASGVQVLVHPDGTHVSAEFSGVPFRYEGEDGALVFARDVTARIESEARIAAQIDELRRWQAVMLDREDRVQELKREVNQLCAAVGVAPRYASQDPDSAS